MPSQQIQIGLTDRLRTSPDGHLKRATGQRQKVLPGGGQTLLKLRSAPLGNATFNVVWRKQELRLGPEGGRRGGTGRWGAHAEEPIRIA